MLLRATLTFADEELFWHEVRWICEWLNGLEAHHCRGTVHSGTVVAHCTVALSCKTKQMWLQRAVHFKTLRYVFSLQTKILCRSQIWYLPLTFTYESFWATDDSISMRWSCVSGSYWNTPTFVSIFEVPAPHTICTRLRCSPFSDFVGLLAC